MEAGKAVAYSQMVAEVYRLVLLLPRRNHAALTDLPKNGVYVFFERGESCQLQGQPVDRVVRVGTHRENNRFVSRIRQHYSGNKNGSVFRKHIGGALLQRHNPQASRLSDWLKRGGAFFPRG